MIVDKKTLEDRIRIAVDSSMNLSNSRKYLVEPVLNRMGFLMSDIMRLVQDYQVGVDAGINYVYLNEDSQPVIAIDARRATDSVSVGDIENRGNYFMSKSIQYLIITNGSLVSLHRVNHQNKTFSTCLSDLSTMKNWDNLSEILSPENIIRQDNEYWIGVKKNKVKNLIESQTDTYRKLINVFLSKKLGTDELLDDTDLTEVLGLLMDENIEDDSVTIETSHISEETDVTEKQTSVNKCLLSDVTYNQDFKRVKISDFIIYGKTYREPSYRTMFIEFISALSNKGYSLEESSYNALLRHKNICQIRNSFNGLTKTNQANFIRFGDIYMGLSVSPTSIINTMKSICNILGINESEITISWIV